MGACESNSNKNTNMGAPKPIISASLPESFELRTPFNQTKASKPKKGDNMIKMKFIIGQNDVNKSVKLLYNIKNINDIPDCNIRELNETNTELFINNEKTKYKPYFTPKKEGIYDIQLKINIKMKSCCGLFYGLYYLQSVN